MEDWLTEKIKEMFRLVRKDSQYAQMQKQYQLLEKQVSELIQAMPEDEQDLFWAFHCLSEAMNWRMLECLLGGFPLDESR